eukprot:TRINITY_DN4890_c0_g1_i1.p1 TRINITY_DN4890_c0_g1~~TRINITY_DN4890_c0_g1_i1.p1  ORF type:complete len:530 (+),score=58.43 TRINITY_DN4890_c0_g1_i1:261-1850(+)
MDTSPTLRELDILSLPQDLLVYIFSFFFSFYIRIHTLRNVRVSCRRFQSIVEVHFCDFSFPIYQMTDLQTLNTTTRNFLGKITSIRLRRASKWTSAPASDINNIALFSEFPEGLNLTRLVAEDIEPLGLSLLNERFGHSLRHLSFSSFKSTGNETEDELLSVPSRLDHLHVGEGSLSLISRLIHSNQLTSLELWSDSLSASSLFSAQTKLTKLSFRLEDKRDLFEIPTQLIDLKIPFIRHSTLMTPSEVLSHHLPKLVSLDIDTSHPTFPRSKALESCAFFWKMSTSLRKLTWRREARSFEPLADLPSTLTYLKLKALQTEKVLRFFPVSTEIFANLQSLKFLHVPDLAITETPLPPHLTSFTVETNVRLPWRGGRSRMHRVEKLLDFPRETRKFKCRSLDIADVGPNIPSSLRELSVRVIGTPVKVESLPPNIKMFTFRVWNRHTALGMGPSTTAVQPCDFSKVPSSVEKIKIKTDINGLRMREVNFEGIPTTVRVICLHKDLFTADQLAKIPPGTAVLECQPLTFDW